MRYIVFVRRDGKLWWAEAPNFDCMYGLQLAAGAAAELQTLQTNAQILTRADLEEVLRVAGR